MITGTSCRELFPLRSAWQEQAFNELKHDLTATKDNRFLKYRNEKETYLVMIYGKSQIGKSTLILKMIGIRDKNFDEVYDILRAGSRQGNSSTVTAIIYAKSDNDQYGLSVARLDEAVPDKKYYVASEMKTALQQVRRDVEEGQWTEADKVLFIDIPQQFFVEDPAVSSIRILDMPGVESRNEKEWQHVQDVMNFYLPFSQVCIVACNASDIQSLETMELPGKVAWRNRPERFMVVSMSSYSPENIRDYFREERENRNESFQTFIDAIYRQTLQHVMGRETKLELFPVDLGQSLASLKRNLNEKDYAEVEQTLENTLHALRTSILTREGQRFRAAIEDLQNRVSFYELDELKRLERKIKEQKGEIRRLKETLETADNAYGELKEKTELLKQKLQTMNAAGNAIAQLTEMFDCSYKTLNRKMMEKIDQENLYREKADGKYLKDQRCTDADALADKKALAETLKALRDEVERYWQAVCRVFESSGMPAPSKKILPNLEIIDRAKRDYYPRYYPSGFFAKVSCAELQYYNQKMAEEAQALLKKNCCAIWCNEINSKIRELHRELDEQQWNLSKVVSVRERAAAGQARPQAYLDELEKQKKTIEEIRRRDQMRLDRYLEVAEKHYLSQRNGILTRMQESVSAEETTKLFLLLALTDRDYENLRRTDDGNRE